ncbi:MAG: hypothetical protein ACLFNQ_04865 [Spirochaetaceae bacterium]
MNQQPGNSGELHFHYNRDERLKRAPRRRKPVTSGSIFRRNRGLTIVLLDVLLLLIVFGIWWGFLRTPEDSAMQDGYRFELSALGRDNTTLVTLTITNRGDAFDAPLFDAAFRLIGDENIASDTIDDRDVLPVPGDVRTMRVTFDESADRVEADIRYGGSTLVLRTGVR